MFTVQYFRLVGSVAHPLIGRYEPDWNMEDLVGYFSFFSTHISVWLPRYDYIQFYFNE
ncbi:hypothetical protein IFVP177_C160012 [Vibrio parahaemolyticus]